MYEIVAVVKTRIPKEGEDAFRYYDYANIMTDAMYRQYAQVWMSNGVHIVGRSVSFGGSHVITLSTCSYHDKNGRLLILATRVE